LQDVFQQLQLSNSVSVLSVFWVNATQTDEALTSLSLLTVFHWVKQVLLGDGLTEEASHDRDR
jgi:hypothetical protein